MVEIILAKEFEGELWVKASDHCIEAKRLVDAEREECAKLCEEGLNILTSDSALDWMEIFGEKFAAAIRARGQE